MLRQAIPTQNMLHEYRPTSDQIQVTGALREREIDRQRDRQREIYDFVIFDEESIRIYFVYTVIRYDSLVWFGWLVGFMAYQPL